MVSGAVTHASASWVSFHKHVAASSPSLQRTEAAMQTQTQLQRNVITLKGSAQIVAEFFEFAVNKCVCSQQRRP